MREVNPLETKRAESWKLFIDAPMPMVTIFKTFDISNLISLTEKGYKLNMLMCYCIGKAATDTSEFYLLPVGKKIMAYDKIAINVIVANKSGGINTCDIPIFTELKEFNAAYLQLTEKVSASCENYELADYTIFGTSSLVKYDIDGAVNMYSGIYNNPFMIWGRYKNKQKKTILQVSFQFHHVQMDGMEACEFLEKVQREIAELRG